MTLSRESKNQTLTISQLIDSLILWYGSIRTRDWENFLFSLFLDTDGFERLRDSLSNLSNWKCDSPWDDRSILPLAFASACE